MSAPILLKSSNGQVVWFDENSEIVVSIKYPGGVSNNINVTKCSMSPIFVMRGKLGDCPARCMLAPEVWLCYL
jgi:hypothetical protein